MTFPTKIVSYKLSSIGRHTSLSSSGPFETTHYIHQPLPLVNHLPLELLSCLHIQFQSIKNADFDPVLLPEVGLIEDSFVAFALISVHYSQTLNGNQRQTDRLRFLSFLSCSNAVTSATDSKSPTFLMADCLTEFGHNLNKIPPYFLEETVGH